MPTSPHRALSALALTLPLLLTGCATGQQTPESVTEQITFEITGSAANGAYQNTVKDDSGKTRLNVAMNEGDAISNTVTLPGANKQLKLAVNKERAGKLERICSFTTPFSKNPITVTYDGHGCKLSDN